MSQQPGRSSTPGEERASHDIRGVLAIKPFRRLWITLGLSSLGDWLGLLALTAMAGSLASGSYSQANFAIAAVLLLRLLPAAVIGPLGGYIADRLDRRWTLVVGDVLRFALFASIPLVGTLPWLYVATLLIEMVSLIWLPAKDAAVPNLVPRERLEAANQVSLVTTYGSALPAAALFTMLSLVNDGLTAWFGWFGSSVDLAMYVNALTFLVGAVVIARVPEISGTRTAAERADGHESLIRSVIEGWRFVARNRLVRGLVIGIVGAFAAGGVVIGLGRTYVNDLGGGEAGYGIVFGAVFLGLALGMGIGPRLLIGLSRRRLFGMALTAAGLALVAVALGQDLTLVAFFTLLLGGFAGVAWVTGYTLLGLEVDDAIRGRTFAFVQSTTRLALMLVIAAAPTVAGVIGPREISLPAGAVLHYNGAAITILLAGVLATGVGVLAYRQMDDRPGVSLVRDLRGTFRGSDRGVFADRGLFIALEGGEATGKTTQVTRLSDWLTAQDYDVLVTYQPGDTEVGKEIRQLVLHRPSDYMSARAEALLFAADKAEHVETVVRPALERGAVVLTDRYVDSSLAYQGAGRSLGQAEIRRLNRFATTGLRPHLTVILDQPAEVGLARLDGRSNDRVESESTEFHEDVRQQFLEIAALDPDRYVVVDASQSPEEVAARIRARVGPLLSAVRPHRTTDPPQTTGITGSAGSADANGRAGASGAPGMSGFDDPRSDVSEEA